MKKLGHFFNVFTEAEIFAEIEKNSKNRIWRDAVERGRQSTQRRGCGRLPALVPGPEILAALPVPAPAAEPTIVQAGPEILAEIIS